MTDYSTLKVVDLKKVLKDRGLPVSGNKADLVKRLQDADEAEAESETVAEPPITETSIADTHETTAQAEAPPAAPVEQQKISEPTSVPDAAISAPTGEDHVTIETIAHPVTETPAQQNAQTISALPVVDNKPEASLTQPEATALSETEVVDAKIENGAVAADLQVIGATKEDLEAVKSPSPVSREAVQADQSRRRKRSSTPLPTENDVHKKLRTASGAVKVTLPEDAEATGPSEDETQSMPHAPKEVLDTYEDQPILDAPTTSEPEKHKSPDDLDEKLSAPPQGRESLSGKKPNVESDLEKEDGNRIEQHEPHLAASPRHHVTSIIYISNLKRPLQPLGLRKHLNDLAEGDDTDSTLKDFYLDPLRTHCFARFKSAELAIRVRDRLHETAWPDEKSRAKLWVDFVPEDKFNDWVKLEKQSTGPSRWKVEYETRGEVTTAVLRDASASQTRPEPAKVFDEPSKCAKEPQAPQRDDRAKGFKTLDDLFSSTTAKPKLYYLPVDASIARRRLQKLAAGRGGGRGQGDARYTFEDGDRLVNGGPDQGLVLDRNRGFVGGAPRPARVQDRRPYDHYRH